MAACNSVEIGGIPIGASHPPHLWPDIDVYFKRDLRLAEALIRSVADSGARFLKAAALHRADLCLASDDETAWFDHRTGKSVSESYRRIVERHVVPLDQMAPLLELARALDLRIVLSVYDREGLAFAAEAGAAAIKIPSSNVTHEALIQAAARTGLPLVIDTGRARFAEIERAVGWARGERPGIELLIQHSPPGPPAPMERFHLRMLQTLSKRFDCPVGLSDHHTTAACLPVAVALGASVIEKGLVADGAEPDIDVAHALPVGELSAAARTCLEAWSMLGLPVRPNEEVPPTHRDRMALVARRDLIAGDRLDEESVDFAFPPAGVPAESWSEVKGKALRRPVPSLQPIRWDDVG